VPATTSLKAVSTLGLVELLLIGSPPDYNSKSPGDKLRRRTPTGHRWPLSALAGSVKTRSNSATMLAWTCQRYGERV